MSTKSTVPVADDAAEMAAIAEMPTGARLKEYTKRSGPGWLQGAITLGGGSLAGALFLGTVSGYSLMWVQPLAMILGVIMLSAIAYVTLSTGQRPFRAINENVSPVLGWAWLIATAMANMVWCMPQFSLGNAAIQENLLGIKDASTPVTVGICVVLLAVAFTINLFYESGGKGIKLFEGILKALVGVVVVSFFGVVIALSAQGVLDWGAIFKGFLPNPSLLFKPAGTYADAIAATGAASEWWTATIADKQRDVIIAAFASAVGINMTFLLPYSMLKKRWGKPHRGLAIFDLSIGLIVPFVLTTGAVVIAAASQFHAATADLTLENGDLDPKFITDTIEKREAALPGVPATAADRELAAMITKRGNLALATTLSPLTGDAVAQKVFGIGVLGMSISTIIILMLINGFTFCEMFGKPGDKTVHMIGCAISGICGFFGPFVWKGASAAALAVPTSVIGGAMLPIAYMSFLLLMNSTKLLGDARPTGARALKWNLLMGISTIIAAFASVWGMKDKMLGSIPAGKIAIGVLAVLLILGIFGFISKSKKNA